MLPTVAATTCRLPDHQLDVRLPVAHVHALLPGLEVALGHGLGRGPAGLRASVVGALLGGDRGPADAEVDDAGVEAEPVEDLDRVVGHLLQTHRSGTPVGTAQPQHEPAVVGGGHDLVALEVRREQVGRLGGHGLGARA